MKITIETIPHEKQRYPTVGDWFIENSSTGDHLKIFVSDLGDWKKELLVAVHELIEGSLCRDRGISQASVDDFDIAFEKLRQENPEIIGTQEPGFMLSAPYMKEHAFASSVERALASELAVDWNNYENQINNL